MKRDAPFKLLFWWSVQTFAGSFSSTMTLLRSLYYQLWKWCATPDTSSVFTFMQSHESLMIMYKTSHLISARTEQIFFSVSYNWCSWLWDYARTECVGTNNSSSLSVYRHRVRVDIRSNERLIWWYNSEKFPMQNSSFTKKIRAAKKWGGYLIELAVCEVFPYAD
jgi:hypothetical protein